MPQTRVVAVDQVRSEKLELPRHSDAPRRQPWRAWAERRAECGPIAVDLFAGAGGLSHGLESAGYTVVLSADHNPAAVETHLANFSGPCLDLDLSEPVRVEELLELLSGLELDLIAGGPPCQPFSRAGKSKIRDLVVKGKRDPVDPRSELWRVFLRVVETLKPKAILMENVPDMALGDDMRTVRFMADSLEAHGYESDMRIIDAWRFGVPQHRQRLFLVATREHPYRWPEPSRPVSLRQAIGDLPGLGDSTGGRELPYTGPRTVFQRRARKQVSPEHRRMVFDHMTRPVRPDDREAFKLLDSDSSYRDLPDELKRYRDDIFDDKYNRLDWEGLSRSITAHIAKDGYWYIHPEEHRTLTVREAARIQTFPDSFRFAGTRSHAFRLIGNAVPPALGERIGEALLQVASNDSRETPLSSRAHRKECREVLADWAQQADVSARWRLGEPWSVLVGTLAGRGREEYAEHLLEEFPTPDSVEARRVSSIARKAKDDRERRIVRAVGRAGRALQTDGWEGGQWASAAKLGKVARGWVETVGLGRKLVGQSAGSLRTASRVLGHPDATGVDARLLLSRLIGYSDEATAVAAGVAAVGEEYCLPSEPVCLLCPVQDLCLSSLAHADSGE